jgi:hypothetical protein
MDEDNQPGPSQTFFPPKKKVAQDPYIATFDRRAKYLYIAFVEAIRK